MPPKQKKPPRNAYYFYMMKRKGELEAEGYRFPGGMKDVADAVGAEWAQMTAEQKAPYEEEARIAKEQGKNDLTNKYTCTGESYAQVQRRMMDDRSLAEEQEKYVTELGKENALDRVFILLKTIHCVEQTIEKNQKVYWPIEVGMVAFTLREGLQTIYWTLVDTQKTPVGYASAAKECSEDFGLPEPGTPQMQDYRDYNKIMKHIQGFISHWTKQGYKKGPVVFLLDQEIEQARGCLRWIANHVDEDKRVEHKMFVDTLKFYKLPKLILKLAEYANELDFTYSNILTQYKLEHSAASIVTKGCYEYKDEITCDVHRTEKASLKMNTCCRNVVLRRMYLMFEEFLPAFGLEKTDRHDMVKLKEAQIAKSKANLAKMAAGPASTASAETHSSDHSAPFSAARPTAGPARVGSSAWGGGVRRESEMMDEDEVSDSPRGVGSYSKRKHEAADRDREFECPPTKRDSFSSSDASEYFTRRERSSRDSPSPPPTYRRLPPEPERNEYVPVPTAEFVPWGNRRPVADPTFGDEDFPALGSDAPQPRPTGVGRGRSAAVQEDNDNGYAFNRDARKYY